MLPMVSSLLAIEKIFRDAGYPEHLFRTLLIDAAGGGVIGPEIAAVTLTGSEGAGAIGPSGR